MKILFFDGYCSFCTTWVTLAMRLDHKHEIRFASLQGETAQRMLPPSLGDLTPDSVIYHRSGQWHTRSTAALLLLVDLGGSWRIFRVFLLLPKGGRDVIYDFIARNRYRLFRRRQTCRIPSSEEQDHLLP